MNTTAWVRRPAPSSRRSDRAGGTAWKRRWGGGTRAWDPGRDGRKPVFRAIGALVWSYYDPYVDFTGRLTGYALVDLRELTYDWRFNRRNMWWLEQYLITYPHKPLWSSNRRYRQLRKR